MNNLLSWLLIKTDMPGLVQNWPEPIVTDCANCLASISPPWLTASGSGLDPHISLRNAELQVPRVAQARGLSDLQVRAFVSQHKDKPDLGLLGDAGINVLSLNLALDRAGHLQRLATSRFLENEGFP